MSKHIDAVGLKIKLGKRLSTDERRIMEIVKETIDSMPTIEVSEDAISREWVKGICEAMLDEEMLGHMLGYIEDAPSVVPSCQKNRQVERAEGEWINKQEKYQMAECSNCKKVTMHEMWGDKLVYYDYCPNCGAKMKGADERSE